MEPHARGRLALATREGKVDVLLRNVNDPMLVDTNGVTLTELTKSDLTEEQASSEPKKAKRSSRAQRRRYRVRRNSARKGRSSRPRAGAAQTLELP